MDPKFSDELLSFKKRVVEALRNIKYTQNSPDIPHEIVIPRASYAPWVCDAAFQYIYTKIKEHTLVDIEKAYELWQLLLQIKELPGEMLEVGTWKGGSGALIAYASEKSGSQAKVYLCDTFKGVVKTGKEDSIYKGGEHSDTSVEIVEELLNGLLLKNTEICVGIFPDDNRGKFDKMEFKFCHIDVDVYESAKGIFEFVWPRMVTGGIVVFDDYGFWGTEGVTKYVNSLQLKNALKIHNLNGHGLVIKQ